MEYFFNVSNAIYKLNYSEVSESDSVDAASKHAYKLALFGSALIAVIVFGVIGNTMVVVSILYNKKLRRESINLLIVSLCTSDYIILLLDRPLLAYDFLRHVHGTAVSSRTCLAQTFFESFGMTALMLDLAILSFERYLTIRRPLEVTKKRARIVHFLFISWVLSLLCGLGAVLQVSSPDGQSFHLRVCRHATWRSWGYFDYLAIPLGAVTTLCIGVMYAMIMRMVRVHVATTNKTLNNAMTLMRNSPHTAQTLNEKTMARATPEVSLHSVAKEEVMETLAIAVFVIPTLTLLPPSDILMSVVDLQAGSLASLPRCLSSIHQGKFVQSSLSKQTREKIS